MSAATYAHYVAAMSAAMRGFATGTKRKQLYERAGAAMGAALLNELLALRDRPQAEALRAVRDKLRELSKLQDAESAAAGFAVAIVNVLEVGIANLPKADAWEAAK